jgi:tetratricopeptide (TPR) repeat protein
MEPKQQRERLEKYVNETYLSKKLTKFTIGDPHDLTKPFRIVLEIADAPRGTTEGGEAAVGMFTARLLSDIPWELRGRDDDDAEPKPGEKKRKPRVHDFVFREPFTVELHYRVHPPAGYTIRELPKNETKHVGTATITKAWSVQPDGVVLADWSIDSGPRRITAAQFETMRKEVAAVDSEKAFLLMFDQTGRKLLDAGEVGKAVAEFRRLSDMHPKDALHHIDVANALLAGGMGEAARREAKRALEIEPKSAKAHEELALTLVHDLVGRLYHRGDDLKMAVAEYRKAKELDPKDALIRARLAEALTWDENGERFGDGSHLADAIDEYLQMKKEKLGNTDAIDAELMVLYSRTGRFADLKTLTETTKETEKKDAFHLVAIAALDGAAAAVKASQAVELSKRRAAQQTAGGTLAILRLYPAAAELLDAAAQGAPDAAALRTRVDLMRRIRRHEDVPIDPKEPQSVFRRFFVAAISARVSEVIALFDSDTLAVFDPQTSQADMMKFADQTASARKKMREVASPDFFIDIASTAFRFQQEGSDEIGGMRIRALAPGAPEIALFVTREKDQYRICGANFSPPMLALRALRLVDAGRSDDARKWLDWARDFVHGNGDDPVAAAPFATFWTRGQTATADEIRLAAAVLLPDSTKSADMAVPVLLAAREKVSDERTTAIDIALLKAYEESKKWNELLAVADRLSAKYPDSAKAFQTSMMALTKLQRKDEAKQRALARLAAKPDDRTALQALGRLGFDNGDYAAALETLGKILAQPNATEDDYNEHAWAALFARSDLDKAIEEARQAVSLQADSYPSLNTLAALYAEVGKSSEARDTLLKSLDALDRDEPQGPDWYIVGRIAENYGINDAAVEAYQHVSKPERVHGSSYELAQKRLAALKR